MMSSSKLSRMSFSKDRDFQDFLKTPEARKVASTLRIRKAPAVEAPEPVAPKPVSAAVSSLLYRHGEKRFDPPFHSGAKPLRCFAPEEG